MDYITVKEAAELLSVTPQHIRKQCIDGKLECSTTKNPANGHNMYLIPISSLPEDVQHRYYKQLREDLPQLLPTDPPETPVKQEKKRVLKPLESYSAEERNQIAMWCTIIREWQEARVSYGKLTEADPLYVGKLKLEHPDLEISVDILYRKYAAYKENDYDGILGIRGGWNRGKSKIPDPVWEYFLSQWLDENEMKVTQCCIAVREWCSKFWPEYLDILPTERAYRYRIKRDVADYIIIMARKGEKASHDRSAPYAFRWYDDLNANDVWIADNHTIDVQTMDGSGRTHRLYLTAFLDAKSGVLTCYNITDTVNSQSTLIALRHGFERYGIPKCIYSDNGREFLTHDIGGMGHRKRKSQENVFVPPTILMQMGIEFRVATVRNARAKPIERTFRTLKEQFSRLFSGYTGGSVAEKKESLKTIIKKGLLPRDSELRDDLTAWIDGIYNCAAYGGAESKYKGMSHIEVWNASIQDVGVRLASTDELNLMMMRTTRMQKVKRNGVKITVSGKELWYMVPEETYKYVGKEVYVRYDPADLLSVRIYDNTDKFLCCWGLADFLYRDYLEDNPESVGNIVKLTRAVDGYIKHDTAEHLNRVPAEHRISALDLMVRRAHRNMLDEKYKIKMPTNIIPVRAKEEPVELQKAAGAEDQAVIVDINLKKIAENAEKRRKE